MRMLIWENDGLELCEVAYDKEELKNLYMEIIFKYGYIRKLDIKCKQITYTKALLKYCDTYEDDLEIIKTFEDNTKVHKGRKRIPQKQKIKRYLYRFTAIDYPEIVHTMIRFLSQDKGDFSIFNKYINADIDVDYNNLDFYIEEGYMKYDNEAVKKLKESLEDEQNRIKYINNVILRRKLQGEYLLPFYQLLTINLVDKAIIFDNQKQADNYQMLYNLFELPIMIVNGHYVRMTNNPNVIKQTPENTDMAKKNRAFIDEMKKNIPSMIKQLR